MFFHADSKVLGGYPPENTPTEKNRKVPLPLTKNNPHKKHSPTEHTPLPRKIYPSGKYPHGKYPPQKVPPRKIPSENTPWRKKTLDTYIFFSLFVSTMLSFLLPTS
jgi:hypothetical protein